MIGSHDAEFLRIDNDLVHIWNIKIQIAGWFEGEVKKERERKRRKKILMSVYGWWRALDIFFLPPQWFSIFHFFFFFFMLFRFVCLVGYFCCSLSRVAHTHTPVCSFTKFEIWFLISSNITGSTVAAAATHLVYARAHTKWRNRSYYTASNFFLISSAAAAAAAAAAFFCFFFRKYCSFFWLPSCFLLTFDAYVFLLAQSLPYTLCTLFLCAVCLFHFSSFARRWNCTDFAILLYFIKLWDFAVCLSPRSAPVSRFRPFRHHETPFHPLLFIFVTMNCKAIYTTTILLQLFLFALRCRAFFSLHSFLVTLLKSIYHSFIVGAVIVVVFKYT